MEFGAVLPIAIAWSYTVEFLTDLDVVFVVAGRILEYLDWISMLIGTDAALLGDYIFY